MMINTTKVLNTLNAYQKILDSERLYPWMTDSLHSESFFVYNEIISYYITPSITVTHCTAERHALTIRFFKHLLLKN